MIVKNKKFHFIAIGGVGMSALAKYLFENGAIVSGSDIQESKYTRLLKNIGVKISIGHNSDLIHDDLIVVASSAIKIDNPEIIRAKELGLKIYHRSDILKMISDEFSANPNSIFIGFSGTHGKTTTSGLASYVLEKAGLNPSFVVGGIIPDININGRYSSDKVLIAELDESDATIEHYSTDIAVINNLDEDHLDCYINGFSDIIKTFNKYLSNKPSQKVIINSDNQGSKEFMRFYPDYNYITFGLGSSDYTAKEIKISGFSSYFKLYYKNTFITDLHLTIPGEHNIYNALAVSSALIESGFDIYKIRKFFSEFSGMGRRFQKIGEFDNITIYDDYAHHPSEIKTTLNALKSAVKEKNRIVTVFQPHRYTRLKSLWDEFKTSFENSDLLIVTDVYSAGENPIDNITGEIFAKEINKQNVKYAKGNIQDIAEFVLEQVKPYDIIITLGAGTITNLGKLLLQKRIKND